MNYIKQLSHKQLGIAIAIAAALLMSLDPIFIRFSGVSGFDTAFLFGLFTAISMPTMMAIVQRQNFIKAVLAGGWPLIASALLMVISATSLVMSVKHTTLANSFFILSTLPIMAALLGWLVLKEITQKQTWFAIVGMLIGVLIVVSGSLGSLHLKGDLFAFAAVMALAVMQTIMRKYPDVSRMASVGLGGAFVAIAMSFFATPSEYSMNSWLIMAMMGLFSAPIGRVASQAATRYITAAEVSLILMLETAIMPILGYFIFNEVPTFETILGGVIIFCAIFYYGLAAFKK